MSLTTVLNKYTNLYSGSIGLGRNRTGTGVSTTDTFFNNITSQGEFTDINYDQKMDTAASRIKAMVINYLERSNSANYRLASAKTKIQNALNFYISAQKENPSNWYWKYIAAPSSIMDALLKLRTGDSLGFTDAQLATFAAGAPYYFSTLIDPGKDMQDSDSANTVHFLEISMRKSLFENNLIEFENNMLILKNYIRNMWVTEHGTKSDYSFHHHIGLMYLVGSYGLVYNRIMSEVMFCTEGTQWQFSNSQKDYIIEIIMKGLSYAQHRGTYDFVFKHKEWFKEFTINQGFYFIQNLIDIGYRTTDINTFISYINGSVNVPNSIRNFYTSNILVHKRNGWHQRVNYASARQLRWTESFENDRSIWGMYLGSTSTMITGNEIIDLLSLCEPNRLPGVTLRQFSLLETPYLIDTGGVNAMRTYPIDHAGGCNSENFGLVIYNFKERFDVEAKKFYFITPVGMFCMGTDIKSIETTYPQTVATAIEQKKVSGTATMSRNGIESNFTTEINHLDINWIWQGNVGYILPVSQNIHSSNITVSGRIERILPNQTQNNDLKTANVFSLWINHGVGSTNASYQYAVIPDITLQNFRTFQNPFTVLSNDSFIQAVRYNNDTYAVSFQKAGFIKLENNITISVSGPGLFIFEFNTTRTTLKINVSDPIGIPEMKLEISKKLSGSNFIKYSNSASTLLEFKVPSGEFIGKSLEINLDILN